MARAVVVGGGVGGLAAAIRLRGNGHDVVLLERNDELGGKLAVRERDGFTFETGPSLLTLPFVFDDLLATAGTTLADETELARLDPQCSYRFTDGTSFVTHDEREATADALDAFRKGAGGWYLGLMDHGDRIWDVSWRTFFAGAMGSPIGLMRRMQSPMDLHRIDALRTLDRLGVEAFGTDLRLRQWLGRYATYSGSSPYLAPATLACIPAIESRYGCWYVRGGLGALRDALVRVASRVGVELRTGADVERIVSTAGAVRGVMLADGTPEPASIVVSDVDAHHLYRDLVRHPKALRRTEKAPRSTSGFVMLIGVDGKTPGLAHHNIGFSGDYPHEFAQLTSGHTADDPTVYVCCSAVTDPSQAPPDAENWFVLVNAPSSDTARWDRATTQRYTHVVLDALGRHGWEVRGRSRFIETITPLDLEKRFRTAGGAIYGSSSDGRQAAFLRPGNRGPHRGLYLVGGSSHPGGGLPLVAHSAAIVADMVREDGW
jgi:phytoene desaturase